LPTFSVDGSGDHSVGNRVTRCSEWPPLWARVQATVAELKAAVAAGAVFGVV
jgi:hypothetical protein